MLNEGASADGTTTMTRWAECGLLLLLLAAFALRSYNLEAKSLWTDEGLTVGRASQNLSLVFKNQNFIPVEPDYHDGTEVKAVATPDVHPPLYFLLMHFWTRLAGQSEYALRFPSVIASTLALPLLFALGRALITREVGLWAALLAASSPFYTWHAQEARMYAWVILLSIASVYTFLPMLRDSLRVPQCLAYVVTTAALLYTHYSGFLLLAFEVTIYTAYQFRKRTKLSLIVLGALVLILIPLMPYALRVLDLNLVGFVARPLPTLLAEMWSYFSLGISDVLVRPARQTGPFLTLFVIGTLMIGVRRRRQAQVISLGYLALPLLLFHITSYFKPNYMNPRHLLVLSPAWELVMAQGLYTLRREFWPGLLVLLALTLGLRGHANHQALTSRRMWKADIRGAVEHIEARARPGDAIVLHDPVIRLTFDYYYDGPYPVTAIPVYGTRDEDRAVEEFTHWAELYDRIWFMYGPPPAHFPQDLLPDWADTHLFKLRDQRFEALWTYVAVAAYTPEPPVSRSLSPDVNPCADSWGPLSLVGFRSQEVEQGERGWLEFYWQSSEGGQSEPLQLQVRLLDAKGTVWYEKVERLLPFYPPSDWADQDIVQTDFRVSLPQDIPPIVYAVEVTPVGLGKPRKVGEMSVVRSTDSPATQRPRARFGDSIALLDAELGSDVFRVGQPLFASLRWQAIGSVDDDYWLRVRLSDLQGREVITRELTLSAAGFATSAWVEGDQLMGRMVVPLPIEMEEGTYRVEISLINEGSHEVLPVQHWYGSRKWFSLGAIKVEGWPLITELPDEVDHQLQQVEIAEAVRLRGYTLAQEKRKLNITLYWETQTPLERSYHVFVHVGTRDQPPVADAGGIPVNWTRPTTTWRQGEIIADSYALSLSNAPPGRYEVLVGFYDPDTGQRPKTVVGGEVIPGGYVFLEDVEIE